MLSLFIFAVLRGCNALNPKPTPPSMHALPLPLQVIVMARKPDFFNYQMSLYEVCGEGARGLRGEREYKVFVSDDVLPLAEGPSGPLLLLHPLGLMYALPSLAFVF